MEEEKMKTILIEEPGKVVIEEHEKPVRKPGCPNRYGCRPGSDPEGYP